MRRAQSDRMKGIEPKAASEGAKSGERHMVEVIGVVIKFQILPEQT